MNKNVGINHNTWSDNVKLYIDEVTLLNEDYELKGWIGLFNGEIKKFKDINTIFSGTNKGASEYYDNKLTNKNMNFKIRIHKDKISNNITVILLDGTEILLENLEKWIVYYSGFNNIKKGLVVVDDFYANPDLIREWTMKNLTFKAGQGSKGKRSQIFSIEGTKERFEQILGVPIKNWNHPNYANETFQYCTADQQTVYHIDSQTYAAMIFLTPDAPLSAGTRFYRNNETKLFKFTKEQREQGLFKEAFKGNNEEFNFYDGTRHELIDEVGNKYNRLVLFDAQQIHAAGDYFGDNIENARYFHIFFFDI
jgi:hypothetical protein